MEKRGKIDEALQLLHLQIGYLDLEMQQKTLALYLEELERAIEQLRREEPEKKRLCWGLGILGGLFLAVVLM